MVGAAGVDDSDRGEILTDLRMARSTHRALEGDLGHRHHFAGMLYLQLLKSGPIQSEDNAVADRPHIRRTGVVKQQRDLSYDLSRREVGQISSALRDAQPSLKNDI